MPMKRSITILAIALLALAAGAAWWMTRRTGAPAALTLYGNVDLRQVDLPFNGSERIAAVLVQEGDRVEQGELLAQLDTSRLQPQAAQAQAIAAAQNAVVERMLHGSRPEEIAEARAQVEQAQADAANAVRNYQRQEVLAANDATSRQDLDNARAVAGVAQAKVEQNRKALALAIEGPRKEDIAQAQAQLRADQAQSALAQKQLADARLTAPMDAVVRSRLMEPGEMASPLKPVFSLAITDPKWVRTYVSETDLGRIHPGMTAWVTVDSFPKRRFAGWIGFISPVAEFTPKAVETTELRSSLVYEVRVFVKDPMDELRLGMPATVTVALAASAAPQPANQLRAQEAR
jgi:HlyD family secretion protein